MTLKFEATEINLKEKQSQRTLIEEDSYLPNYNN